MENNSPNRFPTFPPLILSNNRSINASSGERSLLLGVISSHLNILDARDNDSRTLRHKSLLWDQVTKKFNLLSSLPRSRHQIQTLYKNMKAKAKKYRLRVMEAQMDNSPHIFPEPDPVSELLLQLLAGEHEQRRQLLKQTAFSISGGDFSLGAQMHNDIVEPSTLQEFYNPASISNVEEDKPEVQVKEEPLSNDHSLIESSLLGDDSSSRTTSHTPDESAELEHFTNPGTTPPSYLSSRPETFNEDLTTQESSNGKKRPRLSPEPSGAEPKNANEFVEDFTDGFNLLKYTDAHSAGLSLSSKQCCCPTLHAQLISLAKKEHELRIRAVLDTQRLKEEQHKEKIKLLRLEQEFCKRKLQLAEEFSHLTKASDRLQSEISLEQNLEHLDRLCDSNNELSYNTNVLPQNSSTPQFQNELETFLISDKTA